jgi:hypothetical protein
MQLVYLIYACDFRQLYKVVTSLLYDPSKLNLFVVNKETIYCSIIFSDSFENTFAKCLYKVN